MDYTLTFGSSISCPICKEITLLIHYIMEHKTALSFVDYFWGHQQQSICYFAYRTFQDTAQDIGLPLSPDKRVPQHKV